MLNGEWCCGARFSDASACFAETRFGARRTARPKRPHEWGRCHAEACATSVAIGILLDQRGDPMRLTMFLLAIGGSVLPAQNPNVKLENDLVRVVLAVDEPHHRSALHEHPMNRVMIYVDPGRMTITDAAGKAETLNWNAGTVLWS